MPDDIDQIQETIELESACIIAAARERAAAIPDGTPGDCELCGEPSLRLVGEKCARCRENKR